MPNGFYYHEKFIEIATREDLLGTDAQRALKSCHGLVGLTCGCLEHEGRFPRVISCRWPKSSMSQFERRPDSDDGEDDKERPVWPPFYARGFSAFEHGPLCFLHLLKNLGKVQNALPSPAIFFGSTRKGDWPELDFHTDTGRERSTTYRAFVGKQLASAWVRAWRAHLQSHALGDGIPLATDVLRSFADALDAARFKEGERVLDLREILERHNVRIAFGVIQTDAIISGADLEAHAFAADEFIRLGESHHIETQFFVAHASLIDTACRSVQRFDNHTSPPYFFVAVVDAMGAVHRLSIMPVHVQGKYMIFVDSGQERTTGARKITAGECFHKPTSKSELNELSKIHPELAWLDCVNPWPYRPDWIGLSPWARSIEEQRGFKLGDLPAYDLHMRTKNRVFSKSPFTDHAPYHEIDGTELEEPRLTVNWEAAGIRWWRIPPAIPVFE